MKALTIVIGFFAVAMGTTASAQDQEAASERLTAGVLIDAAFPVEVFGPALEADAIAARTCEDRLKYQRYLDQLEPMYDSALRRPDIPVEQFQKVYSEYGRLLSGLGRLQRELKLADDNVIEGYYHLASDGEGIDPEMEKVYKDWLAAARASYVTQEEQETSLLLLEMGRERIVRELMLHSSAPITTWRVSNAVR